MITTTLPTTRLPSTIANPDDWCIRVSGEEVACNTSFQCHYCGTHNEGGTPRLRGRTYARVCEAEGCGEEYPVQPYTEEK